jgi:single-stranded-DNA-specific exonuclease
MAKQEIRRRSVVGGVTGWPEGTSEVIQRVYAARGIEVPDQIELRLAKMISPTLLGGLPKACELLAEAILQNNRITIAGDYDCDGATGSAVGVRGLRLLGATDVEFIVPNRFVHGYGLSPGLVADIIDRDVIVTVDSGVSSHDGVKAAKARGMTVIVTDHHLPGATLPDADAIVNPNLDGDSFPSKALAGVGVMFYLLLALRKHLRELGRFTEDTQPDLSTLLDLVALGTIADLVVLDLNNRILVDAGMRRIRQGRACVGIQALIDVSRKKAERLVASDIAFTIAPKLNAAGRLEEMSLGVRTLITDDPDEAQNYAAQLDRINSARRELQATMTDQAESIMLQDTASIKTIGVTVFDPSWHAGIIGLVASKLKESLHRPVFAFAPGGEDYPDEVRASGRSIAGFHLRDALAVIDARHPGMILKFGGHAMAAGLSLKTVDIPTFSKAFDEVATAGLDEDRLQAAVYTDGELAVGEITLEMAYAIRLAGPWGQGFPEPVFDNVFDITEWRVMAEKHLKLFLRDPRDGSQVQGVMFNAFTGDPPPVRVRLAYELSINVFREEESLQLMVRHMEETQ